ncbi:MAG: hypothetical protein RLZZ476_1298, partial [Verrucomicrobiota bacterium]
MITTLGRHTLGLLGRLGAFALFT